MTQEHDYEAASEWVSTSADFLPSHMQHHYKTIQSALRIAQRLQIGEVSFESRRIIENLMMVCGCNVPMPELEERFFKAMAAQLLKEEK